MPIKALIVDDSPVVGRVISLVLRSHKIKTKEALNGKEALSILNQDPSYDLVMIDWNMPEMNGLEFITEVRRRPQFKHLKLFIVTANDTIESFNKAKASGADDYLTKPISRNVVSQKLHLHGLN